MSYKDRCVVCNKVLTPNHKCSRHALRLWDKAERLAALAEDPEEPGLPPLAPKLRRRFAAHGIYLDIE